ncbi:nickel-dependent hydrogenase large subunit [Desulfothermus sp.]
MGQKITIDPITRIEGHLAVKLETERRKNGYIVTSAFSVGAMFRGFEVLLKGRDPLDAQQITQRICGVCPISQGIASCKAQENAYGIKPNKNGRLLQNLILAANYIQSHIVHFYHLSVLDYVDVTSIVGYRGNDLELLKLKDWAIDKLKSSKLGEPYALGPFLPRYEGEFYLTDRDTNIEFLKHYLMALDMRRIAHEMCAVFGAKVPHSTALVPGGCTQIPSEERVLAYRSRLQMLKDFVERVYIPDVFALFSLMPEYWKIGKGYRNLLAYGVFDLDNGDTLFKRGAIIYGKYEPLDLGKIREDVKYSRFSSPSSLHPSRGETIPDPDKRNAYTWIKAPRYDGHPMEVGPLARIMVDYHAPGKSVVREFLDGVMKQFNIQKEDFYSVAGRHVTRALELKIIIEKAMDWLDDIDVDKAPARDFDLVKKGEGVGLTEAPRGALGHWLTISDYKIDRYQCVVPSTWNFSPRDDKGNPGPVERSLIGVRLKDSKQPMEAARVIRSFDPCLACAIH